MTESEFLMMLRSELQPMKDDLRDTKDKLQDFRLYVENVLEPKIQLLAENYVPAAKRYERTAPEINDLKRDVDVMKRVITEHSIMLRQMS